MLTESFIASVQAGPKNAATQALPKDASIFLHDFQPRSSLKGTLKKSNTNQNCLAWTNSHIFGAQADKALIHVYSRDKGTQETIVPFPFRITSLARIGAEDGAAILAIGTERGGLLLWELCTGRLVSTEPSHLQSVTCLVVDATATYLLSGSADSGVQVWSLPTLLSFTDPGSGDGEQSSRTAPLRHMNTHRGAITALMTGHSHSNADFAISASEDKTCLVWNYRSGELMHTFLMPDTPLCIAIDPADRAFYAGLSDGSIQMVNFHRPGSSIHLLYDRNMSDTPTQALKSDQWQSIGTVGKPLSISVSYDGTKVLTGHDTGKILTWEVGQQRPPSEVADLGQPVTNLAIVSPTGFPNERKDPAGIRAVNVIKPRPDAFPYTNGSGLSVPHNYTFTASFVESIPSAVHVDGKGEDTITTKFEAAIQGEHFPDDLLRDAIGDVLGVTNGSIHTGAGEDGITDDNSAQSEVTRLKAQLKMAELQKQRFAEKLIEANQELEKRDNLARMKKRAKSVRRAELNKRQDARMGNMSDEELSEDTDVVMPLD